MGNKKISTIESHPILGKLLQSVHLREITKSPL